MQLIEQYARNSMDQCAEDFLSQYFPLVRKIACHFRKRLPSNIDLNDLIQSGVVGLLEAKKTFRDNMGASFETYAGLRIKGSIIDSLRKNSCCPRDVSLQLRRISQAIHTLEQKKLSAPTSDEIADFLEMSMDEFQSLMQKISFSQVTNGCEYEQYSDDSLSTPYGEAERISLLENLQETLSELPRREQEILSLYYIDDFSFKQIGEIFELTEARICQLHAQAIARIKVKMCASEVVK